MNVPVSRPADAPFRGVLMMCFAVACFAAMNTFVKELRVQELPVVEIIWGRYFFHTILVLALFPKRIPTLLSGSDKGLQICRSILVLSATACMFTAVGFMPLADAVAITFIAPLLITALSVPFLGERVGLRRWIAVCVGFAGMLVIIRPGGGLFQPAALLPIGVTVFYAMYQIITRMISRRTDPINSVFYTAIVGGILMSAIVPFFWQTPTLEQWGMMLAAGLLGGLGHWAIIIAYQRAEAPLVAPFAYTELVWATMLGLTFFGDFPDLWTLVGAAIIAASGVYILQRERQQRASANLV
ncbi:MAG: DMT family transporter [Alphaproteobacteria bacterium]|nr:DMT family transporter [Alphaproteobacteria bacterium]